MKELNGLELGRTKSKWENNVKILQKYDGVGVDGIDMAQDKGKQLALVKVALNSRVQLNKMRS